MNECLICGTPCQRKFCSSRCRQQNHRNKQKSDERNVTLRNAGHDDALLDELRVISGLLAQLVKSGGVVSSAPQPTSGNLSLPDYDASQEDQEGDGIQVMALSDEEKHRRNYETGKISSWNALINMSLISTGSTVGLKEDVVAYGLSAGLIPESALATPKKKTGGPKKMDVPQFEAPVFDDEELSI